MNRTTTGAPRPRSVSTYRARPVSGLVGSGLSPSRKRFACSGIVTNPHSHTVAGAAQAWACMHAVPVSRFTRLQESLADTSNECCDFTQYRRQTENIQARRRWNMTKRARPGPPSGAIRQRIDGPENLRRVNQIGRLIHHGKSIENCLLLLDLSRFMKV